MHCPRYPPFRFLSYCPYHTTAVVTHRLSVPAVTPLTTSVTGSPPLLGLLPLTTPHSRRRSSCCVHCRRRFDWGRRSSPNPAPPCFGQAIDYLHQLRRMSTTPTAHSTAHPVFLDADTHLVSAQSPRSNLRIKGGGHYSWGRCLIWLYLWHEF